MRGRPHITTHQRRARLLVRHHLARTAPTVERAATDLVAVHSSDPVTPYLAMWARVPHFAVGDLERALYDERSLWRLHAMRRTLFVVPTRQADVLDAACGRDVASAERRKLETWVGAALAGGQDSSAWLDRVQNATLAALSDGEPRRTQDLTDAVDGLALRLTVGTGRWTTEIPLSSRLLSVLALEGRIVRTRPAGSWLSSQYLWANAASWFASVDPGDWDPAEGRAFLTRAWLRSHAPATTTDLQWWAGWTLRRTRAALAAVEAVEVDVDGPAPGWVLPDDIETPPAHSGPIAFLPGLDPTTMGWKHRHWYLGDHAARLFDRNGNAGPTIWVDGRVVGGWAQRRSGEVVTRLLEDVGGEATARVAAEAGALTRWCDGVAPTPRFRTPLERELSA